MTRVLAICTVELSKNGISTCVLSYLKQIASEEIIIDIVAPNKVSDDIKAIINEKKMTLYELTMRKTSTLKYFMKLRSIVLTKKYDVVHVHGNSCTMAIELLAATLGCCRTRIAHSHNTTCEHMKAHKLLRPVFELCCNKRFACGEEAGKWLFRNKDFNVIKNGVVVSEYAPSIYKRNAVREKLNIDKDVVLLGHIGVFNFQKNHEFFIPMINKLKELDSHKYKLLLIGDGKIKSDIFEKVKEFDLEDMILFIGNVTNIPDYLQAIDLFLLPSRFEGLPYVLVEAQAATLRCLVSDHVSKEADLTESIEFMTIDSVNPWIDFLKEVDVQSLWSARLRLNKSWSMKIADAGYDIAVNAEQLKQIYMNSRR